MSLSATIRFSLLAALVLLGLARPAAFAAINNVTVANVSANSFSVLWQGSGSPGIQVFADPAGTSNLANVVSIENFPLHSGNADAGTSYDRRQHAAAARANGRSLGIAYFRVGNCRPGTPYYVRLTATSGNDVQTHPAAGLMTIVTPNQTSFVRSSDQVVIDVPGIDNDGRIVTLTHPEAAYALAAVIGDGAGTNQVFFSLSDLLDLAGEENFSATGSQEFEVDLWGANQSHTVQEFTLVLSGAFQIAQAVRQTFGIEFGALALGSAIVRTGQSGSVPLTLNSSGGISNVTAQLLLPLNRLANLTLSNRAPAVGSVTITSNSPTSALLSIRAAAGQNFAGQMLLGNLSFTAVSNQSSAFVDVKWAQPSLVKTDLTGVSNVIAQAGRIVVLGPEPLLEAGVDPFGARQITMYGIPWQSYGIEYSPALGANADWRLLSRIPLTNQVITFAALPHDGGTWFYRAYEFKASPPLAEAQRQADGSRRLLVFGQPGAQYTVQSKTNLSGVLAWTPVVTYTLSNSFRYVEGLNTNLSTVFYRLQKN